jgi:branched-chain amino acid transport system permease protein
VPFVINDYWENAILLPFLIYSHRRDRAEHPDGLLRAGLARHGRVHGGGRLCRLQADDRPFPWLDMTVWSHHPVGLHHRRGGVLFGLPSLAHQGVLPGRGHAGGAVLPGVALQQGAVVLQLLGHGPDHGAGADGVRYPVSGPETAEPWATYLFCLVLVFVLAGFIAQT